MQNCLNERNAPNQNVTPTKLYDKDNANLHFIYSKRKKANPKSD